MPAIGYGIRYEFGIFDQAIRDGWQVELTDKWLRFGNPWEIARPEITLRREARRAHRALHATEQGRHRVRWLPGARRQGRRLRHASARLPVVARRTCLRLWKAEAVESFDFDAFNVGDYYRAVDQKVASETISKVLYPNDEPEAGKQLRLAQQFFFVSCSLQDMIRLHADAGQPLDELDVYWAAQLNDTHPAIAVAELMRLLIDEHGMEWDAGLGDHAADVRLHEPHAAGRGAREMAGAAVRRRCCRATSRSCYEINRRFLDDRARRGYPGDEALISASR